MRSIWSTRSGRSIPARHSCRRRARRGFPASSPRRLRTSDYIAHEGDAGRHAVIGGDSGRPPGNLTLDNWQTAPQLTWSFQHIADLFPTATISRGTGPVAGLPTRRSLLGDVPVKLLDGSTSSVGAVMGATDTDGWIVVHDGRVLAEEYPRGMSPEARHLLMSVSKSLVGTLV